MNADVRKALLALGYRRVGNNKVKWAKPVAWQTFTFEWERMEVTLWFLDASLDANGEMRRMGTKAILVNREQKGTPTDLFKQALHEIKGAEADMLNTWTGNCWSSKFEFLTREQNIEFLPLLASHGDDADDKEPEKALR